MKLQKNKKGSHVGFVLSFTLFITFLIFIYAIIAPSVRTFDDNTQTLESFKKKVIENVSDEVVVIRVDDSGLGGGVSIDISNLEMDPGLGVVAFNSSVKEIPVSSDSSTTNLDGDQGNVILYYHEDFVRTNTRAPTPGAGAGEILNVLVEKRILETKILELINLVENNYSLARETLDLVGGYEFDVQFRYENGTLVKNENDREYKTNIYAKEFKVSYLTINAREELGDIIIKIW